MYIVLAKLRIYDTCVKACRGLVEGMVERSRDQGRDPIISKVMQALQVTHNDAIDNTEPWHLPRHLSVYYLFQAWIVGGVNRDVLT